MDVLVIVPTFNERESLPELAEKILALDGYRLLVVDDASPDGTAEVAEALVSRHPGRIEVIRRRGPRGLGRSYVEGFRRALASDAAVVCQMDADLSHDPAYLPAMVSTTREADLVIGSRYLHGISVVNWPLHRIMFSAAANQYVRWVTGLGLSDCTSGYRCWRREALERIPLERLRAEGYSHAVECLYEADRAGCRIVEIPIVFVERRRGKSKLTSSALPEALMMPLRLRLRDLGRRR